MKSSRKKYSAHGVDDMMEGNAVQPLIPIGISSCLIGELVRFDGGHKQS
jgi:hypothetical protein